jgi:signal transduction histidine kinase
VTATTEHKNKNRFIAQQSAILEETRKSVEAVRRRAIEVHQRTLKERNRTISMVNQNLKRTVDAVKAQHRAVTANLRREAINKDVHISVSRGLESLEELVRYLRRTSLSEESLLEAVRDPALTGTLFDRERRASVSGLVQSVQVQLAQQAEFLNVAAHELRTPIMPIIANAELLYEKVGTDTREVDTIVRNGMRLMRLAENILSVTKIESGSVLYKMEATDLNAVLRHAILDLEHTIRNKNVRILFVPETDKLVVTGDEDKLGQVVGNILDNALKFTTEGRIIVTSRSSGGLAEVSISDEGPGIDPEIYPVLFSKFATRSAKGTGLGLFICRSIIDAHGGTIWATNVNGPGTHGSVFTFVLPLNGAKQDGEEP